jgi:uncharacterized protein YcfJ
MQMELKKMLSTQTTPPAMADLLLRARMRRINAGAATCLAGLLAVAGCARPPMGPDVAVMPGPNKPFDVFATDQESCKQYASQQVQGQAEATNDQAVGSAMLGTVLGAGLGAAVGGGRGAAVGAASGAGVGTIAGTSGSQRGNWGIQRRYDIAYEQCMSAKGNQIPVAEAPPYPAPAMTPPGYPPVPGR